MSSSTAFDYTVSIQLPYRPYRVIYTRSIDNRWSDTFTISSIPSPIETITEAFLQFSQLICKVKRHKILTVECECCGTKTIKITDFIHLFYRRTVKLSRCISKMLHNCVFRCDTAVTSFLFVSVPVCAGFFLLFLFLVTVDIWRFESLH